MSNGFYFTPVELACFMADSILDDDGNVVYGSAAAAVVQTAIKRAQRSSTRKERVNLSDPEILANYKAKLTALLAESSAAIAAGTGKILPEYKASLQIGLGKVTVTKNSELHNIYMTYARIHSNAVPSTLNNDLDDYFDSDD